ncbi:MAG: thiamine pyrophosphate-binding protein [Alphaproteobacteria bacterium]|nr:thiamine pyrophosphate-binding protein [Alphaproteobacteria bacterium]
MTDTLRGADIVARTLDRAGMHQIFTLSGNHIMEIFDATIGTKINLTHVRQEGAAVMMAGAWAELTGNVGLAMVTGGPGHTNAVAALCTPLASEMPMVLISGHAPTNELGRGSFQELPQAEMAATVTKASWMAESAAEVGYDLALAIKIAASGRPGPVHLSLPSDVLEGIVENDPILWPSEEDFTPDTQPLSDVAADAVLAALDAAERPLILVGPHMCTARGRAAQRALEAKLNVPVVGMASPRGLNDPCLGAFAEELQKADLIVLLGKPLDFTLKFGDTPSVDADCKFVVVDPDIDLIERASTSKGARLIHSAIADSHPATATLTERGRDAGDTTWREAVHAAITHRPDVWQDITGQHEGTLHALDLCRGVKGLMERNPNAVLIMDGGEIGQWAQANLDSERRITNGVAGSIGAATPFAFAARVAETNDPVITIMGDGTFGFHMAEFDTAVRNGLPVVAVVGNDACWNAEHQIQIRDYGENRAHSCELLPARYDQVVEAMGGHGELVTKAADLPAALDRALASGKPACVNVMIESVAAPIVRRS